MSDFTYKLVRGIGLHAFLLSSRPILLHRDRIPKTGGVILGPTHLSHYDVPLLIATLKRNIDFMSVVEFLKKPWVGALFRGMNCFFLDRGRIDAKTVREAIHRLERGRLIAMFPEGQIRDWEDSAIHGNPFKPGVARLAVLANAPILPCIVIGGNAYKKAMSWLPLWRTRYGVNFGELLAPRTDLDPDAAQADLMERLSRAYVELFAELRAALPEVAEREASKRST